MSLLFSHLVLVVDFQFQCYVRLAGSDPIVINAFVDCGFVWADDPPIVCSRCILEMAMSVSWFNGEREDVKEVQPPNLS